jgi:hypothetical protein
VRLLDPVASVAAARGRLAPLLHVRAGAEGLAGARHDERTHRRLAGDVGEPGAQRAEQRDVQRVARVRAVQRDRADGVVVAHEHEVVGRHSA